MTQHRVAVAFFGKPHEPLSQFGLRTALTDPGVVVTSVTCTATREKRVTGPLIRLAAAADVPVVSLEELESGPAPDLVLSFSNSLIFREPLLSAVRYGIVNMHPAPLPEFRGNDGIEHCLVLGETRFGATLHYCDAGIDTGPIIEVRSFEVTKTDNARRVWRKVDRAAEQLLLTHLPRLAAAAREGRRLDSRAQDQSRARFFRTRLLPGRLRVDLDDPWVQIQDRVRAYDHPRRRPAFIAQERHALELGWRSGRVVALGTRPLEDEDLPHG